MFEQDGELVICYNGIHFCRSLMDCFKNVCYYPGFKVAEVIAHGEIIEIDGKCCTNKLEVVKEISQEEYLEIEKYTNRSRQQHRWHVKLWWDTLSDKEKTSLDLFSPISADLIQKWLGIDLNK